LSLTTHGVRYSGDCLVFVGFGVGLCRRGLTLVVMARRGTNRHGWSLGIFRHCLVFEILLVRHSNFVCTQANLMSNVLPILVPELSTYPLPFVATTPKLYNITTIRLMLLCSTIFGSNWGRLTRQFANVGCVVWQVRTHRCALHWLLFLWRMNRPWRSHSLRKRLATFLFCMAKSLTMIHTKSKTMDASMTRQYA
jgi:hypothetical protein